MGKDTRLINIYLSIHNKRPLTMDDLCYLAQYAPDCFEKTCKNVIYNIPEAKPILEPETAKSPDPQPEPQLVEQPSIDMILDNLKRLETNDFPISNIAADEVKSLLGNLYMELLFPHNDRDTFFDMTDTGNTSSFDVRA